MLRYYLFIIFLNLVLFGVFFSKPIFFISLIKDVCFLDIEIYRKGIKSMGHHMLSVYNSALPDDWSIKFKNCIQPNLMRGYDRNNFRLKYPLATIHLLIGLLEDIIDIKVEQSTIFPLLFTTEHTVKNM